MRPAQRVPWYAWLLIGALPVAFVVGLAIHNDTIVLGALGLMPIVAPITLFYWMRKGDRADDDGSTGG
jgi:hypothetical protein